MSNQTIMLLSLIVTIVITSAIVWCSNWIKKNKEKYPELYQRRGAFGMMLYIILNLGDLLR